MLRFLSVALIGLLAMVSVSAQSEKISAAAGDKYIISAKAGGINFVEGTVGVVKKAGRSGLLLRGDKLEIGDRVSTGADGKAEVLLNPGSYLRLGSNSAFEFRTTSLDDLQIRLDSGSAIFEVFATEDFKVTVNSPKTRFTLIESGIYRVDVAPDGAGKIAVWKGRAQVGDEANGIVKSGREATLNGSNVSVAKFDRDDKDALEIWSKGRAKELAKISGSLAKNNMRTALMRSYLGRSWNMYDSFGVWVYDPFRRSHCFLPFGYGWNSPYGYGFGHSIWYYNLPVVVTQPPRTTWTRTYGPKPVDQPAFVRAQGTSGSTGRDFGAVKPGRGDTSGGYDPVRSSGSGPVRSSGGPTYSPPPSSSGSETRSPGRVKPID